MVARAAGSLILAGALVIGASGCSLISDQATLNHYDPSDGVSATVGTLGVRNVIALSNSDGSTYSLLITMVNAAPTIATVTLQYQSGGVTTTTMKSVRSNSTASFGNVVGQPQILIKDGGVPKGGLFPVYLQSGDAAGVQLMVPVLDGSSPQYAAFAPPESTRAP